MLWYIIPPFLFLPGRAGHREETVGWFLHDWTRCPVQTRLSLLPYLCQKGRVCHYTWVKTKSSCWIQQPAALETFFLPNEWILAGSGHCSFQGCLYPVLMVVFLFLRTKEQGVDLEYLLGDKVGLLFIPVPSYSHSTIPIPARPWEYSGTEVSHISRRILPNQLPRHRSTVQNGARVLFPGQPLHCSCH